ncbi:MAG: hypothetical protein R2778_05520 [Saprospiraceae bacterium]
MGFRKHVKNKTILYVEDLTPLLQVKPVRRKPGKSPLRGSHGGRWRNGHAGPGTLFEPDICVLDVMLPIRAAFLLAPRSERKKPHLPIVFITAKSSGR